MPRLELWLHIPTQDRYIVLSTAAGPQNAGGPLSDDELAAIQAAGSDSLGIPWVRGLERWVAQHAAEFVCVW